MLSPTDETSKGLIAFYNGLLLNYFFSKPQSFKATFKPPFLLYLEGLGLEFYWVFKHE